MLQVCAGMYKLYPSFVFDQGAVSNLQSPHKVLGYAEADLNEHVRVLNPDYDFVAPELVSTLLTNYSPGCISPSYVYRLMIEYYAEEAEL